MEKTKTIVLGTLTVFFTLGMIYGGLKDLSWVLLCFLAIMAFLSLALMPSEWIKPTDNGNSED